VCRILTRPRHRHPSQEGCYFAEDIAKTDQYAAVDREYEYGSSFHKLVYRDGPSGHPRNCFYVLLCRVVLGHQVHCKRSTYDGANPDVFAGFGPEAGTNFKELRFIPGVDPPQPYHSLLATHARGSALRFREFVLFNTQLIQPAYLIAYHRGSPGQVSTGISGAMSLAAARARALAFAPPAGSTQRVPVPHGSVFGITWKPRAAGSLRLRVSTVAPGSCADAAGVEAGWLIKGVELSSSSTPFTWPTKDDFREFLSDARKQSGGHVTFELV
jgi:hypothetical protein